MDVVAENLARYKDPNYNIFLKNLLTIIENDKDKGKYVPAVLEAIRLGPEGTDEEIKAKTELLCMIDYGFIPKVVDINENYGKEIYYIDNFDENKSEFNTLRSKQYYIDFKTTKNYEKKIILNGNNMFIGGDRRKKPKAKHDDMNMKDIKDLCKANQIKLSKVVEGKNVAYKKKELLTKLKRKKII